MKYLCMLVLMTLLGSIATLFLKKASGVYEIILLIKNKNLYAGSGLYILAAIINIYVLRYFDYSTVLPLTSLTYIWTMLLSWIVLKEKMTIKKVIGTIGIIIGAVLIAK